MLEHLFFAAPLIATILQCKLFTLFSAIERATVEKFLLPLQCLLIYLQLFHSTLVIQQVFFPYASTQQYF